jgi:hypothetical protein
MSAEFAAIVGITNKGILDNTPGTRNFTPTVNGWYTVRCQGAGGGSGGIKNATIPGAVIRSGGGGAGEYNEYKHYLTAGTAYSYTVGAGGTAGTATPTSGGTGGDSSFSGVAFTQTALGGAGSLQLNSDTTINGSGATGGRRDGVTTASANTISQGQNCWGGANGATTNTATRAYAGCFTQNTSSSRAGAGAPSLFHTGGLGVSAVGVGTAGARGSGAGGSWSATITGQTGAAGGNGEVHIEFLAAFG